MGQGDNPLPARGDINSSDSYKDPATSMGQKESGTISLPPGVLEVFEKIARDAATDAATDVAKKVSGKVAQNEVKESQIKLIEILGLFVGVFSFVSINFQILGNSNISSLNDAIFFSIILFFLLGGFVFLLHSIFVTVSKAFICLMVVILFMLVGLFFLPERKFPRNEVGTKLTIEGTGEVKTK